MKTFSHFSYFLVAIAPVAAVPFPWRHHHSGAGTPSGSAPSWTGAPFTTLGVPAPTGASSGFGATGTAPASAGFPTLVAAASSGISPPSGTGSAPVPSGTSGGTDDTGFLRGINIGNWLILERWMDSDNMFSDAFSGANDQWNFDSIDGAADKLKTHWDTWFTEDDVQKLAGWGFNALRIPIGYWAYNSDGTPFIQGADDYLEKALGWARSAGMKVLIDMHGSPGSQNGQDHSGHAGAVEWQQDDNLNKSTAAVVQIAQKYGTNDWKDVVWGIETVNEPTANSPNNFDVSKQWSLDAYNAIQAVLENKDIQIYTHDSFLGPKNFLDIGSGLKTFGVDQHDYQLYTNDDNALDQQGHIAKACGWANDLRDTKAAMPVIVGEWSCLSNVCVGDDGSTWAGTSCDSGCQCTSADTTTWNDQLKDSARQYVEAQLDVYEQNTYGYFVWSYKAGGAWGPENLIANGVFPQPLTDRKFPGQCSS